MRSIKPFIKLNAQSEKLSVLLATRPQAFTLLTLIAKRAKRADCPITGLKKGEAIVSDFKSYGATSQSHRTNISTLKINGEITTRLIRQSTTQVLVVKLISTDIYDINVLVDNISTNDSTNTSSTSQVEKSTSHQHLNQHITKNIRNKEKELKNNKFENLEDLTDEVVQGVADEYEIDFKVAKQQVIEIDLYCKRNGKKYKDYRAVLQTWIRGALGKGLIKKKQKIVAPEIIREQTPEERERSLKALETIRKQTSFLANSKSIGGSK